MLLFTGTLLFVVQADPLIVNSVGLLMGPVIMCDQWLGHWLQGPGSALEANSVRDQRQNATVTPQTTVASI